MQAISNWSYPEELSSDEWLVATYFVELPAGSSAVSAAREMAIGQTTGTWVELPDELMKVVTPFNARFEGIYQVPPTELRSDDVSPDNYVIRIAYPLQDFANDLSILITILSGNESATSQTLKLMDIEFPKRFLATLPGPRFGIEGIRNLLGIHNRPLLNNMLKPCLGMPPEVGARLVYETAVGGVDIIKDDEKYSYQEISPIAERVKAYKAAIRRAEEQTGYRCLYAVNISSCFGQFRDNALRARDAGADMLMVNFLSSGLTAMQALASDPDINLPILAHTALAPIWYESPRAGISSHLIMGKLPRLAGSDLVIQFTPYARYPIHPDRYLLYTHALTTPLANIKPCFPLIAGGVHPRIVPRLVQDLGIEFTVGAGGAIQGHPKGTIAGAQAMRQALEASAAGIPLEEYAQDHEPLRLALEKWK